MGGFLILVAKSTMMLILSLKSLKARHENRLGHQYLVWWIHPACRRRLTVADSTALYDFARRRLLDLAHKSDYHTCLIVFTVPRTVCLQRDQQRPRHVGEAEIFNQDALLLEALQHIHREPWEQIHVLSETDAEVHFF
jgi:tRNA uridine 5-carbamoylmethylation protein Kti12